MKDTKATGCIVGRRGSQLKTDEDDWGRVYSLWVYALDTHGFGIGLGIT
jgi:hypothetical protein